MVTRTKDQNTYAHGEWNTRCDVCGFKFKACDISERWDGLMVCADDHETRHPSDFFKAPKEDQDIAWTRPDAPESGGTDINGNPFGSDVDRTIEYVPDPAFDDNLKWDITNNEGTAIVSGGVLTCSAWRGIIYPVAFENPAAGTNLTFSVKVDTFGGAGLAVVQYGDDILWTGGQGTGTFTGTLVESGQTLSIAIAFTPDNLVIDSLSIIKNEIDTTDYGTKVDTDADGLVEGDFLLDGEVVDETVSKA